MSNEELAEVQHTEAVDRYLAMCLEGYETGLQQITQGLEAAEKQLKNMRTQREDMVEKIAELKMLLGLSEEDEAQEE